ncbi:MAG: dihydrolipoyl dehydrogenase [Deltaproteobacteria bacterium HGW-Deltaproteobacteria-23]|nr:MAG: dihydrolipoyl dehydrogenase [Deltaproteobacteria bacterium HGW-Deltaproteobacteria-23]
MADKIYDLIIIGGGPGGYVAAIRASQLGMNVAVVEQRERLGGVCLNEGCIPSKALLDSSELFATARDKFPNHGILIAPPRLDLAKMMARKDDVVKKNTDGIAWLFKKNKITLLQGRGKIGGKDGECHTVAITMEGHGKADVVKGLRILLATGSKAVELPGLPFDGTRIVSAREALAFGSVPDQLLVIGAGYIGLELGSVWLRLGAEVTVVEMLDKPLPAMDGQAADTLVRSLKKQGMKFMFGTKVNSAISAGDRLKVSLSGGAGEQELLCDKLLVAVGRKPLTENLGLEEANIMLDVAGRVIVDDNYRTTADDIYAIGDLIHGPMLAHKASEEGVVFAERLQGQGSRVEYEYLPGVCYTWPEAASAGKTEEQLKSAGVAYSTGRFNFLANGRARCMDETDGFVKILAKESSGRVLGIHIVGPRASDLIAEAVTAMTFGATAEDIAMTFHAHPTLAEAIKEAALDVIKRALHA